MTHTISQDSGVGDFGNDGLDEFRNQHKCGARCSQLGLKKLKEDDTNQQDDDDDGDE
ncbi:hypothetical protein MPER_13792 [Moniliophthora perniciosa FA553]|nr:hypothetical protein MPER_13792 [Moniliophthora perniciosa FA553]